MTTWIVLAHRAGARVFQRTSDGIALVETIDHPRGRLRDQDIDSDRPGVSYDSSHLGRSPMGRSQSPHERVAETFAELLEAS